MNTVEAIDTLRKALVLGPWTHMPDYGTDSQRVHPLTGDSIATVEFRPSSVVMVGEIHIDNKWVEIGEARVANEDNLKARLDAKLRDLGYILLDNEGNVEVAASS